MKFKKKELQVIYYSKKKLDKWGHMKWINLCSCLIFGYIAYYIFDAGNIIQFSALFVVPIIWYLMYLSSNWEEPIKEKIIVSLYENSKR